MSRWDSVGSLIQTYSPQAWSYTLSNAERAYLADSPTLNNVNEKFGIQASNTWMRVQVKALFILSSSKDEMMEANINSFADCFAQEVKGYTMAELMLFFGRYKAGRYDNSYSSFDPKRIGNAFFFEFLKQREAELKTIDRNEKQVRNDERECRDRYISEHYEEIRSKALSGDIESLNMLHYKSVEEMKTIEEYGRRNPIKK